MKGFVQKVVRHINPSYVEDFVFLDIMIGDTTVKALAVWSGIGFDSRPRYTKHYKNGIHIRLLGASLIGNDWSAYVGLKQQCSY